MSDMKVKLPATWVQRPAGIVIGLLIRLFGGVRSEGLENLPRTGPMIVVANHPTLAEPLLVPWATCYRIGRIAYPVAKAEVRRWPIFGWLGSQGGVIYVRRGEADRASQRQAFGVLEEGEPLVIFPEGTRSHGGLLKGRNGTALLAMRSGAPVVPVGVIGSQGMLSVRAIFGPRPRVTVRIGEPFHLPYRPDGQIDRAELVAATDLLMRRIAELLPPHLRGMYG